MTLKVKVDGAFVATGGGAAADEFGWVRNPAWPAFPAIDDTDEKFIGQKAVFDHGSNHLALLARGAYTVDWGDGVVEDFADNVQAEHLYDFANANLYSHADLPYKVATVTVTPQVAASLTLITLDRKHTGITPVYDSGWLDVALSMPNAATGASVLIGGTAVAKNMIERVRALNIGGATSLANMCNALRGLQEFEIGNTIAVTDMTSMFRTCSSLKTVPLFNTIAVTNMGDMFRFCSSLQTVPLFNTIAVTNMTFMFNGCTSLQTVPLFNTIKVENMARTFEGCSSLQTVPLFNTIKVNTMLQMFSGCPSLQTVPLFVTAGATPVTVATNMFASCSSLQSIPAMDLSAVTTTTNMFGTMTSLSRIEATPPEVSFSVLNCNLSRAALVELFTNLDTVGTEQTLTITGNWGIADLTAEDRLIATNKNWTLVE